ncbi:MAG TPA: hypothetical protein VF064_05410, partial [Pyrinomonadaceae bacterium]
REVRAADCPLCGELPDELIVRTGRDQRFPAAFNKLVPVGREYTGRATSSQDYRCPDCGADFVCEDYTQQTGSGINDEVWIIRAPAEAPVSHRAHGPSYDYDAAAAKLAAEAEAAYARQAFGIMEKHFAGAGVVMKHPDPPKDWSQFCSRFYLNTVEFAERGSHTRLMAGMLAELVDLMYASPGRKFINDLYRLLVDFRHYSWLEPLLPDAARSRIDDMVEMRSDAEDEDERFRLGQMSY